MYVAAVDPLTVPRGAPFHEEIRLTTAQLFPTPNDWHGQTWAQVPQKVRPGRVPPQAPAVLNGTWHPAKHTQAPTNDLDSDEDEGWVQVRVNSEEEVAAAVQAAASAQGAAAFPRGRLLAGARKSTR